MRMQTKCITYSTDHQPRTHTYMHTHVYAHNKSKWRALPIEVVILRTVFSLNLKEQNIYKQTYEHEMRMLLNSNFSGLVNEKVSDPVVTPFCCSFSQSAHPSWSPLFD